MTDRIIVEPKPGRTDTQGYPEFIDALQFVADLTQVDVEGMRWSTANVKKNTLEGNPNFDIDVGEDHPVLSIGLFPVSGTSEDVKVTGEEVYTAPMMVRDVRRFGDKGLGELEKYKVQGWLSPPDSKKEMFEKERTLSFLLNEAGVSNSFKPDTPIVEAVALLPIAPGAEFATEFCPTLNFPDGRHTQYQTTIISQDRFCAYILMGQFSKNLPIKKADKYHILHNWSADFVPDLSDVEQLMTASSRSHMIIIAKPYAEKQRPLNYLDDISRFLRGGGNDSFEMGGPLRGFQSKGHASPRAAEAGDVNIGEGRATGKGQVYTGEAIDSDKGNTVIYHLCFLGIKPDKSRRLGASTLTQLAGSLNRYDSIPAEAERQVKG